MSGRTDVNGRISQEVFDGRRYEVSATKPTQYAESAVVPVPASGDVRDVKLVLKRNR